MKNLGIAINFGIDARLKLFLVQGQSRQIVYFQFAKLIAQHTYTHGH